MRRRRRLPRPSRADAIKLVRTAYERGVAFFGMAINSGPFRSEEIVGEALAPVRDRVIIATNLGYGYDGSGKNIGLNSRPEYIKQMTDGSLRRDSCTSSNGANAWSRQL